MSATLVPMESWGIWLIAALGTAGVILRPWRLPEAVWAVSAAVLLVVLGLLPWRDGLHSVARGTDVYLFLVGMMLLAELARREGLFDWLAARAARAANGSATRLFLLIYAVGTVVTVFLSNDATAVVLTPAVYAAARAARAEQPLPYLFVCAFVANAASFVLPISNPANLVLFGEHMPPLLDWLRRFALPSVLSILATGVVLWWTQRSALQDPISAEVAMPDLHGGGRLAAWGLGLAAVVLLGASAAGLDLGLPTFLAGLATLLAVTLRDRQALLPVLRDVSWSVLPLVAGLFALVGAVERTGLIGELGALLGRFAATAPDRTAVGAGVILAIACNLLNNLPAGLVAASALAASNPPEMVRDAVLIGVDIGPNLSVTGSLATILWLTALRREGEVVSAGRFLLLGAAVMPPALLLAIAARLLAG